VSSRSTPCTVKKTFEIAKATGNDLIVQVKENQPNLQQHLEDLAATAKPLASDHRRNRARNRQEDRLVEVFDPAGALGGTEWASLIAALVRVRRRTLIRSAATGAWTAREETALYASSVMLPAATFADAIRNHWAIENRSHYVRDVTLAEDASRIRINPGIMARLRSYVLNIARANGAENIARALWIAAIDPTVSLSYKGVQ
jgi:predicted transposase YbfD/YdcC